jgi:hypothetical protein
MLLVCSVYHYNLSDHYQKMPNDLDVNQTYLQSHTKQNLEGYQRYFHYVTSDIRETAKILLLVVF